MTTKTQTEKEKIREKIDEYIWNPRNLKDIVAEGVSAMKPFGTAVVWLNGISGKVEDMTLSVGFRTLGAFENPANIMDSIAILEVNESSDLDIDDNGEWLIYDDKGKPYYSCRHNKYTPSQDEYSEENRLTKDEFYAEKVQILRITLQNEYIGSAAHDAFLNDSIEEYLGRSIEETK